MIQRYAVVDENGDTQNIVLWDGVTPYNPGIGLTLVPESEAKSFVPTVESDENG